MPIQFQVNDHIPYWGLLVRVISVHNSSLIVTGVDHKWTGSIPKRLAREHCRGYWLGKLIPAHRRVPTLISPYEWSHVLPRDPTDA